MKWKRKNHQNQTWKCKCKPNCQKIPNLKYKSWIGNDIFLKYENINYNFQLTDPFNLKSYAPRNFLVLLRSNLLVELCLLWNQKKYYTLSFKNIYYN